MTATELNEMVKDLLDKILELKEKQAEIQIEINKLCAEIIKLSEKDLNNFLKR